MRLVLVIAMLCCSLGAQEVSTRDGNIFVTDADGLRLRLTGEFRDLFPVLSPEGKRVAFARTTTPETFGDETMELCVVDIGPGEPPPRCAFVVYQEGEDPLSGFRDLAWSGDGRGVYFLSDFSRTASGLCRFDTATGKAVFLAAAERFAVLRAGQWSGMLVAAVEAGEAFPYFVVSPDGERVARVGEPGETIEIVVARLERP